LLEVSKDVEAMKRHIAAGLAVGDLVVRALQRKDDLDYILHPLKTV